MERLVLDTNNGALVIEPTDREGYVQAWTTPAAQGIMLGPEQLMLLCQWIDRGQLQKVAQRVFMGGFDGGAA